MRGQHLHTQLGPENDLRSPLMEGYLGAVTQHLASESSGKQLLWMKTRKAERGPEGFRGSASLGLGLNLCNAEIMVLSPLSA